MWRCPADRVQGQEPRKMTPATFDNLRLSRAWLGTGDNGRHRSIETTAISRGSIVPGSRRVANDDRNINRGQVLEIFATPTSSGPAANRSGSSETVPTQLDLSIIYQ
jgi:hypothetical protein